MYGFALHLVDYIMISAMEVMKVCYRRAHNIVINDFLYIPKSTHEYVIKNSAKTQKILSWMRNNTIIRKVLIPVCTYAARDSKNTTKNS